MNLYLSTQLAAARQASLLDDARRQRLIRQSRIAHRTADRFSPLRPARRLRLAVWQRGRVPA